VYTRAVSSAIRYAFASRARSNKRRKVMLIDEIWPTVHAPHLWDRGSFAGRPGSRVHPGRVGGDRTDALRGRGLHVA
jgi:hypothetical protein